MFRLLIGLTAVAALGLGAGAAFTVVPVYLPFVGLFVALLLAAADGLLSSAFRAPTLVKVLMGLSAAAFILLGLSSLVAGLNWLPDWMQDYWPPADAAIVAAVVVALNYVMILVPVTRGIVELANPYFEDTRIVDANFGFLGVHRIRERTAANILLGIILFLNIAQVYLTVLLSFWGNRFYTALQDKDYPTFKVELAFFGILATFWVLRGLAELYITFIFKINWRRWLTDKYVGGWLADKNYYRLGLQQRGTDNPDQRISEDINQFIDKTSEYYVQVFVSSLSLYAFVRILWVLSDKFAYSIGNFELTTIPGYLVWIAFALAVVATIGTHYIGRSLVPLNFNKQRLEANFRYSLVRVRENSEQIALLDGERNEQERLMSTFGGVIQNTLQIAMRQTVLRCFTLGYQQAMVVVPLAILAPAYFTNPIIKYGLMSQTRNAFGDVQDSFSLFVTLYQDLTEYKAIVNRLLGFEEALDDAEKVRAEGIVVAAGAEAGVAAQGLSVVLPGGEPLFADISMQLRAGERTLVTGTSGSGKTTLFRTIAGIWPFGRGKVEVPAEGSVMLLPQQTYMPLGTLRAALTYPEPENAFADAEIREALALVGLSDLAGRLDATENWSNALSGGEKQRVSIIRALLRKPAWLFLDEATSAVDEQTEAELYGLLRKALPATTVVSIGHRSSLARLHDRRIDIVKDAAGARLQDAPLEAFGVR